MSRDWLLYLDDLIASAEKVVRFTQGRSLAQWQADEAAFDAVLFNLQVIGEAIKKLPETAVVQLSEPNRTAPARACSTARSDRPPLLFAGRPDHLGRGCAACAGSAGRSEGIARSD